MTVSPTPTAVTRPAPETVAISGLSLENVAGRPESGSPSTASAVTVRSADWPTSSVSTTGSTRTVATGSGDTATDMLARTLSIAALTRVEPADTPVTSPASETEATPGSSLDQVAWRLGMGMPLDVFGDGDELTRCSGDQGEIRRGDFDFRNDEDFARARASRSTAKYSQEAQGKDRRAKSE